MEAPWKSVCRGDSEYLSTWSCKIEGWTWRAKKSLGEVETAEQWGGGEIAQDPTVWKCLWVPSQTIRSRHPEAEKRSTETRKWPGPWGRGKDWRWVCNPVEKMQCKLLPFVWRIKCSHRLNMHSHINKRLSHWLKMIRKEYECVGNRLRKMWLPAMESTAPASILRCTEAAGLEDVLEFVPRVQRDHMQKEHNTEQTTQFAPLKKKQEINASPYV